MSTENLKDKAIDALLEQDVALATHLYINGKKYELQTFETEFIQPHDFKGKPQHQVKGGLLSFTIRQKADKTLNDWMFHAGTRYDGMIVVVPVSRTIQPLLTILFEKGACISYEKLIGQGLGIELRMLISPESIKINEIEYTNQATNIWV